MQNILLTGAGFSRNWGGWLAGELFEYLIGCPEVARSASLREKLWRNQREAKGFESALAELQVANIFAPSTESLHDLRGLERAIGSAFGHMNKHLCEQPFEWFDPPADPMKHFLARFDALFTLNQDLLLEHHYKPQGEISPNGDRWLDVQLPGMVPMPSIGSAEPSSHLAYVSAGAEYFLEHSQYQPLYKLHGSYGWSDNENDSLLIMGDNKAHEIDRFGVLKWYFQRLQESLRIPDTRLMIIGYSFQDEHINEVIVNAIRNYGVLIFVVDPTGSDIARNILNKAVNASRPDLHKAAINLVDAFEKGLIGASRRYLREIFKSDRIEYAKLMRFFERP